MIDTHCHLTYDGLRERVPDVLAAAATAGVDRVNTIGTTPADALRAQALAHRFAGVYFSAGLHPHHAPECPDRQVLEDAMLGFALDPRLIAVGEMGLDRHYPDPPMDVHTGVHWCGYANQTLRERIAPVIARFFQEHGVEPPR